MSARSTAEFYRDTVRKNESGAGGWSKLYYGTLTKVIRDRGFQTVVEVGIGYGLHAKELLKNTELRMLYLVDPMKFYPNDGFAQEVLNTVPPVPGGQFDEMVSLIKAELAPWASRYRWIRKESLTVVPSEISDESIDCVFVDGDHSYAAVKADLAFWWKKVRPGGMMLGDDYWMDDVAIAVHEFALENNVTLTFAENPADPTYKIFQFTKASSC